MYKDSLKFEFIHDACINKKQVEIYLISGLRLSGIIESFDDDVILLNKEKRMIIFQHIIATILV